MTREGIWIFFSAVLVKFILRMQILLKKIQDPKENIFFG